jgi:two-component system, OmpR family, KDP operon response regulator KdpE
MTTPSPSKILVVDDEAQITRVLRRGLEAEGYQVRVASDGLSGLAHFRSWLPDVVITDLRMAGLDGLEFCARIRQLSSVPLLVLSVKEDEQSKVKALDLGADDYVSKPFSMAELNARLRALLRRVTPPPSESAFRLGDFTIDPAQRQLSLRGEPVHLTPKEFDLLQFFMSNPGRVLTQRAILTAVWGSNCREQPEYLRVFVGNLRKKIERDPKRPRYIRTEPWIGYRFDPE